MEAWELSCVADGSGWVSCLFLFHENMAYLLRRANKHCPSPECFVFSVQPAVCYQAITKKLKVCEEVRQILIIFFFNGFSLLSWGLAVPPELCALFFFFFYPLPPRKQDPPPSRQQTAQQSMAVSHLQTKSKISNALQPFPFLFLLPSSYMQPLSSLSLRINKPNISL